MSLVSIIVPVYNTEDWLARCLNSILNQTFEDFEVIVVNDGFTDNSGKICKDFAKQDKRIKYIELVKNGGLSTARNLAIKHSAGRFLFCRFG